MALNSQSLEETLAIFKAVEREIKEDKSPNVGSAVEKGSICNNHFNADPNNILKRSSLAAGQPTTEGKRARVAIPVVSPSSTIRFTYLGTGSDSSILITSLVVSPFRSKKDLSTLLMTTFGILVALCCTVLFTSPRV